MDAGAGDGQVVVGALQVEVRRVAASAPRRDDQGREAGELEQRRDAGRGDQRLLEAGGLAGGLAVDQGRIAVALRGLHQAAAHEAGGQAVADGDVAGEVGRAGVRLSERRGRQQESEREDARESLQAKHRHNPP
jgi:hypothetical protein